MTKRAIAKWAAISAFLALAGLGLLAYVANMALDFLALPGPFELLASLGDASADQDVYVTGKRY